MKKLGYIIALLLLLLTGGSTTAQELNCNVRVNHSQVQGTNTSVFETLQTAIAEFLNNTTWTDQQYQRIEKIEAAVNITVTKYEEADNRFTCTMLFTLSRPVFNSVYGTTTFSMRDENFNFSYKEYDPLEFNETSLDNNLTAMLAYYAYLFIGLDMDTFSPLGGTAVLHQAESIVSNAQNIAETGWKAFESNRNRHGIINDYLETSLEPFRQMMYQYHRKGLDEMANNADRGRVAITQSLELLKEARSNKPMSDLPLIFSDYKRDELVNIYSGSGHGTEKEKEAVFNILTTLNASQNSFWNKIKK